MIKLLCKHYEVVYGATLDFGFIVKIILFDYNQVNTGNKGVINHLPSSFIMIS